MIDPAIIAAVTEQMNDPEDGGYPFEGCSTLDGVTEVLRALDEAGYEVNVRR